MSKQCEINQSLVKSTESTFEIFGKKSRKMEDFFFHFFKKLVTSGYLKTGYLTGYLRVEVTRKKSMPLGGGGPVATKARPNFSKISKYCPNYIIIMIKVVGDVPRSVRDVSEHVSDDLL